MSAVQTKMANGLLFMKSTLYSMEKVEDCEKENLEKLDLGFKNKNIDIHLSFIECHSLFQIIKQVIGKQLDFKLLVPCP